MPSFTRIVLTGFSDIVISSFTFVAAVYFIQFISQFIYSSCCFWFLTALIVVDNAAVVCIALQRPLVYMWMCFF